jgi:hypothetical protein
MGKARRPYRPKITRILFVHRGSGKTPRRSGASPHQVPPPSDIAQRPALQAWLGKDRVQPPREFYCFEEAPFA